MSPAAGWYADPTGVADLRLWDGERWSDQTRSTSTVDPSDPGGADNRRRGLVTIGVAALVIIGLVVAADRVLAGSSSPVRRAPNATPTTLGVSPTGLAARSALPTRRPSPTRVLAWLNGHGFQLRADPATPAPAGGACDRLDFVSSTGGGTIWTYPSYRDAAAAHPSGGFSAGIYVVALQPSLAAQLPAYRAAFIRFMSVSDPAIPLATLMSPSTGGSSSH